MTDELRDKIGKLYELVKRGATAGESNAAKRCLDNLLKKHNLEGINLDELDTPLRKFKYTSKNEMILFGAIVIYFLNEDVIKGAKRYTYREKAIGLKLKHIDFITIECAYEYFRRHMRAQWKKTGEPELRKCRNNKTRNRRRAELQNLFVDRYIIASKLYKECDLTGVNVSAMTKQELQDRHMLSAVEGGVYNVQVQSAHQLPEATFSTAINQNA